VRARVCTTRYDSITDQYSQFLLDDVLPALETTAGLKISSNPEARGLVGISSSGVCAFAACWNRPDAFRKVISHVGR
jgi:enterochelin esterase family protein